MSRHPFRNSLLCVLLSLIVVLLATAAHDDSVGSRSQSGVNSGGVANTTVH